MYYVFDPITELYYAVTATLETETGLVTLNVSQTGVPADPGYVPTSGEPICPIAYYALLFNLDVATIDGNRYQAIAMSVTRYIERYCCYSWQVEGVAIPEDLLYTSANMIRDRFAEAATYKDPRLQSESVRNYSYTLAKGAVDTSVMTKYQGDLDMFRVLPFA